MLSFWENKYFTQYDFIIIGSGIVGLSTAYYLRKRFPTHSILVLERGLLPTGASTKNAGFACMGSATELLSDLEKMTEQDVVNLFQLRKNGLERLKTMLNPEQLGFACHGSYELISPSEKYALDKIEYLNQLLNTKAFRVCNEQIDRFGFNRTHVVSLIENLCEGEIDTGLMMKNLLALVMSLGIEIKTGGEVLNIQDEGQKVHVSCKSPFHNSPFIFKSQKVFVCTNAFTKTLFPELDIQPGRGQVLITKPIANLKFKGTFHLQEGYYYFRAYENRVLFGGGRNLDFKIETSTEFNLNEMIQQDLVEKLREIILPDTPFEIDQQWTGIMAFGPDKNFILKSHSQNVHLGVRMNGMGVAIGSEVGFRLANII